METLARAIHSAHLMGVVHRDLSPANILLAADGVPKITDFGLAKLLIGGGSLRTQTGDLLGTPSYMAPEQAGGRTARSGRRPTSTPWARSSTRCSPAGRRSRPSSPMETLRQVLDDEPVSPSRLRPRLPRDLETICLKCLRKEPARRYATAQALADDLRRFLEGRPILARRSTSAERFWRWCRRNPWLAAANIAAAALTVILAVGSTMAAWTFRYQRDQISLGSAWRLSADRERAKDLFEALVGRRRRPGGSAAGPASGSRASTPWSAPPRSRGELKLPPERFELLRDEAIACLALPDLKATGRVIHSARRERCLIAFDPAMTRYALRFRDGTVQVRRVADDEEVARFEARGDRDVFVFGFSPDGRYLATTHTPGFALTVWDIDQRAVVAERPRARGGLAARFSPDSRRIAVAHGDGDVLIYDLSDRSAHPALARSGIGARPGLRSEGNPDRGLAVMNRNTPTCRIVEADSGRLDPVDQAARERSAGRVGPRRHDAGDNMRR